MSWLFQDLRFALRSLRKDRVITAVAVVSLALAIGGNSAVFSLVDAFIFRPLPYDSPERLVAMGERQKDQPRGTTGIQTSLATYEDLAERSRTMSAWSAAQFRTFSVRGADGAEPVTGGLVTPGFFSQLGVPMAEGRGFRPEEGVEGAAGVVVISQAYRERSLAGTDALGAVLTLDGEPYEVVGVLPPDFNFLNPNTDLWMPLAWTPGAASRERLITLALGRMAPGATMEQVAAEMAAIATQLEAEHPETQAGRTLDAYNMRYDVPTPQTRALFGFLQGTVFLVLLVACANIMNLLLVRGQERSREIALRSVLGAGRWRILRQLLTESLVLVLVGGALGLALGIVGIDLLGKTFGAQLPPAYTPRLDGRVVLFTLLVAAGAGAVFGLVPALGAFRQDHADALKDGAGRSSPRGSRKRFSRGLVVAEIALSMVALGIGSLVVRSFLQLREADPGFRMERVLTATVAVPSTRYEDDERRLQLVESILERARAVNGVEAAAMTTTLPLGFFPATDTFRVDGVSEGRPAPRAYLIRVSTGYLETLGVELLQGRFFDGRDRLGTTQVAVVNRSLAEARFGERGALGRRIDVRGEVRQIVGVVADVQQTLVQPAGVTGDAIYLPVAQAPAGAALLAVRTTGDPHAPAPALRASLQELDPDLTLAGVRSLEKAVDQAMTGIRVFNVVLTVFGLVALFLAALGTYAVLAYSVAQRRHEIGIRMAIGARPAAIVGMVSRQGLWMAGLGLAIGLVLVWPLVGVLRSLLQNVSTVQPFTLVGIAAVLFGVTMLASVVPARRAAAVDPAGTLREE